MDSFEINKIVAAILMVALLIIGIGNIGIDYAFTRHNLGFDVLNYIAKKILLMVLQQIQV